MIKCTIGREITVITVYIITQNNMWPSLERTVINISLINTNLNITKFYYLSWSHKIQEPMDKLLLTINVILPEILNHMQAS